MADSKAMMLIVHGPYKEIVKNVADGCYITLCQVCCSCIVYVYGVCITLIVVYALCLL